MSGMKEVQMKWSAVEETFPQMDNQYKGDEAAYRTAVEALLGTVKAEFVRKMDLRKISACKQETTEPPQ